MCAPPIAMATTSVVSLVLLTILSGVASLTDYHDPHCCGRQTIVHLFEWKWADIAEECENFLGPKGFCGVQTSPANEYTVIETAGAMRPWWERYQPVSYKLTTRSGDRAQFKDMVDRCKAVGVRIYVDVVVNHMAGLGRTGKGTAGTPFDSDKYDFHAVPYSQSNFNVRSKCPSGDGNVNNYGDPNNVRNCNLVGLTDLDQSQTYVQDKIAAYFNDLISLGVAGFRVDAAKHMWPQDLAAIQSKTNDLPEGGRPFFYLEVIDRNDGAIKVNEYYSEGYVTEFRYSQKVKEGASDLGRLAGVYDPGWGMADSDNAFVFVDNHDSQRSNQVLTYKDGDEYKRAVAFTLAYNYGFARVMSSYAFTGFEEGPPHNADYSIKDVTVNTDGSCGNGWVCEHRWPMVGNMAQFRTAVAGTSVSNWQYTNGVLSFSRGNKGFFAMSMNSFTETVQTGLPGGEYCDLISECKMKITVDGSGNAQISPANPSEPYVAIAVGDGVPSLAGCNVSPSNPGVVMTTSMHNMDKDTDATLATNASVTQPIPTEQAGQCGFERTLIMFEKQTVTGQDVFIRGGIDHSHRTGCTHDATTSNCSIPIRHLKDGDSAHYDKVNAWNKGDNFLDWDGAEAGQGSYQGNKAVGTAAFWSSNNPQSPGYNELNTFGEHYWIVDVEMDCCKTMGGLFEVKALVNGQWEGDIHQASICTGIGAVTPPYSSANHFASCGFKNVFHFGTDGCEIEYIS